MMESCQNFNYIYMVATVIVLIVEAYLGKTDKTKSGSTLELFYNILTALLRRK